MGYTCDCWRGQVVASMIAIPIRVDIDFISLSALLAKGCDGFLRGARQKDPISLIGWEILRDFSAEGVSRCQNCQLEAGEGIGAAVVFCRPESYARLQNIYPLNPLLSSNWLPHS